MIDETQEHRHQNRQQQQRPRRRPHGGAGRGEHDQLAVGVEPVERMQSGDEKRERRDDGHQVRQGERRHLDQHPGVLTLAGDDVQLPERQRDPDDARKRKQDQQKGPGRLAKHVSRKNPHERGQPPRQRAVTAACPLLRMAPCRAPHAQFPRPIARWQNFGSTARLKLNPVQRRREQVPSRREPR